MVSLCPHLHIKCRPKKSSPRLAGRGPEVKRRANLRSGTAFPWKGQTIAGLVSGYLAP